MRHPAVALAIVLTASAVALAQAVRLPPAFDKLAKKASNTVQVTLTDLSLIGKVIDTGIQAGANRVQGLSFGLQDDQPSRAQALKMATAQAKANADAMASGIGQHTGAAIAIQQGGTSSPTPVLLGAVATASATTPVETGVVNVQASVTLDVALVP